MNVIQVGVGAVPVPPPERRDYAGYYGALFRLRMIDLIDEGEMLEFKLFVQVQMCRRGKVMSSSS